MSSPVPALKGLSWFHYHFKKDPSGPLLPQLSCTSSSGGQQTGWVRWAVPQHWGLATLAPLRELGLHWRLGSGQPILSAELHPISPTHRKAGWCRGGDTRNQPQAACTSRALLNANPEIHVSHLAAELICLSKFIPTPMAFIRNFSSFEQAKGETTAIETTWPSHPWMDIILTLVFCSIKKKVSDIFLKHRVSCMMEGKEFFWSMQFNCATKHQRAELPSSASHRSQLAGEDGHNGHFITLQTSLPCPKLSSSFLAAFQKTVCQLPLICIKLKASVSHRDDLVP